MDQKLNQNAIPKVRLVEAKLSALCVDTICFFTQYNESQKDRNIPMPKGVTRGISDGNPQFTVKSADEMMTITHFSTTLDDSFCKFGFQYKNAANPEADFNLKFSPVQRGKTAFSLSFTYNQNIPDRGIISLQTSGFAETAAALHDLQRLKDLDIACKKSKDFLASIKSPVKAQQRGGR